ncbi:MAG: hypothetical protein L0Z50_37540, partial [Verrucomicrobiales bacterium]|nr:hypothetical protein [Verrucomicrobiales bacterium]
FRSLDFIGQNRFLPFAELTFLYCLRESEQNRTRTAVAKDAGGELGPQRGVGNVLCQSPR